MEVSLIGEEIYITQFLFGCMWDRGTLTTSDVLYGLIDLCVFLILLNGLVMSSKLIKKTWRVNLSSFSQNIYSCCFGIFTSSGNFGFRVYSGNFSTDCVWSSKTRTHIYSTWARPWDSI